MSDVKETIMNRITVYKDILRSFKQQIACEQLGDISASGKIRTDNIDTATIRYLVYQAAEYTWKIDEYEFVLSEMNDPKKCIMDRITLYKEIIETGNNEIAEVQPKNTDGEGKYGIEIIGIREKEYTVRITVLENILSMM